MTTGAATRGGSTGVAFATVTTLFFAWGFITSLIDPLVASVKAIFTLTTTEAQLSTFAFFIAFGFVSIPAAVLTRRIGKVPSVLLALAMMIVACFVIRAGADTAHYPVVLAGLFVLASGITILQVAANPLSAILGKPEMTHFRLNFSQAFNSLATVLGPLIGAKLLLQGVEIKPGMALDAGVRHAALGAINTSFTYIAGLIVVVALVIWALRKKIVSAEQAALQTLSPGQISSGGLISSWSLLGGLAIFLYVGAEVSIGTQLALFLSQPNVWNVALQNAGYFVSLYWGGAMVGRFLGSALLARCSAAKLLGGAAAIACVLCGVAFATGGYAAGYAAIAVGLFNSIMFPTIFTLTLERSTASEEATSGLLVFSIIGGAFLPLLAGRITDMAGYQASFLVPLACYAIIVGFAVKALGARIVSAGGTAAVGH